MRHANGVELKDGEVVVTLTEAECDECIDALDYLYQNASDLNDADRHFNRGVRKKMVARAKKARRAAREQAAREAQA